MNCSSLTELMQGSATGTCLNNKIVLDIQECAPANCAASTTKYQRLAEQQLVVEVDVPGAGFSGELVGGTFPHGWTNTATVGDCSALHDNFTGTYNARCDSGVTLLDASTCELGCMAPAEAKVMVMGTNWTVHFLDDLMSMQQKGGDCADLSPLFNGTYKVSCAKGTLTLDGTKCMRNCVAGTSGVVDAFGDAMSFVIKENRTDSEQWTTACDPPKYSGSMEAICENGSVRIWMMNCVPNCVAEDTVTTVLGGSTRTFLLGVNIVAGASQGSVVDGSVVNGRDCSTVDSAWVGGMTMKCERGTVITNVSMCEPKSCYAGQLASVHLGSQSKAVNSTTVVKYGASFTEQCATVDPSYIGEFKITCGVGTFVPDTSTCQVAPGVATVAQTVVRGGLSFSLSGLDSASVEDVQASMESPAVKTAIGNSVAASLGVAATDVTILGITVTKTGRRLSGDGFSFLDRRLAGGLAVAVTYQVVMPQDSSDAASTSALASQMKSIGGAGSSANTMFTSTLATELTAAAAASGGTGVLAQVANTVATNGVTVLSVDEPQVLVIQVPSKPKVGVEDDTGRSFSSVTAEEKKDSAKLWINLIAGGLGFLTAGVCLVVWYRFLTRDERMAVDKIRVGDAGFAAIGDRGPAAAALANAPHNAPPHSPSAMERAALPSPGRPPALANSPHRSPAAQSGLPSPPSGLRAGGFGAPPQQDEHALPPGTLR
jgi:hypothetical protein